VTSPIEIDLAIVKTGMLYLRARILLNRPTLSKYRNARKTRVP
jgi:hypothetical protein